jgi:hypothetical protein
MGWIRVIRNETLSCTCFFLFCSLSLSQKKMRQEKKDLLSFTRWTYIYILKMLYNHYSYDLVHREEEEENEYKEGCMYI